MVPHVSCINFITITIIIIIYYLDEFVHTLTNLTGAKINDYINL